jgi:Leucine-rich repeat (LRR) protein
MDLSNTQITDVQLEELTRQLINLEKLDLNGCSKLQNIKLANCQQLKELNLMYT